MRGRSISLVALACASCALFPGVDGLDGDASVDGATSDASDGASDATTDAGVDAIAQTDASWSFLSTQGNDVTGTVTQVSVGSNAMAGDLVIVACDTEAKAGVITLDTATAQLAPHTLGPYKNAPGSLETMLFWGVLATTPNAISMTATTSASASFLDCSIDVYRGGTPSATLVASKETEGTGAPLVTCGPVATAVGGVAFYIAVRYTCAGTPSAPFMQRQDLEGNPTGDVAPTTGAMLQTTLGTCNNSTGDWVCLLVAISP